MFEQVCIIGLGLIGASLAQAIKDRNLASRIVAVDSHISSIDAALNEAVIDAGSDRLEEVVAGSDCIIIAVPVKAVAAIFNEINTAMQLGLISTHCLLSDVCSTKKNVVQAARESFIDMPSGLVPAHPIAGAEHSGFHARRSHLFVNHNVIICELKSTDKSAINSITKLWEAVGATVMTMDVDRHDAVLAYTSHLPHLLAFNLVDQLASHDDNMDIFRYAAGGFRDFTRIAASDPVMWHDIFIANKSSLLKALDEYSSYLSSLRGIIDSEDSTELLGLLGRAQSARQHFGHMLTATPYTKQLAMPLMSDDADPSSLTTPSKFMVMPSSRLQGNLTIPADALISQLSIILGSLAQGTTKISGVFEGEDSLATIQAFRDMGVTIEGPDNSDVTIHGVGIEGLKQSHTPLYMGHSGTSMRLLSGLLVGQSFDSVLTADTTLSNIPMESVAGPLRMMGAMIQTTGARGTAPISIKGHKAPNRLLHSITYEMPAGSSVQIKSSLLLAALYAKDETTVIQPTSTVDHIEQMLKAFGYEVRIAGNATRMTGGGQLTACNLQVPADISSAAFFIVAASIAMDSELTLGHVGVNPTRSAVINIMTLMGADICLSQKGSVCGEPVADIKVKSAALKGVTIPARLVSHAVEELPILMIAASCAIGSTIFTGANELRGKAPEYIDAMTEALLTLGIKCRVTTEDVIVEGKGSIHTGSESNINEANTLNSNAIFDGGEIRSYDNHLIAMSFAVAGVRANDNIVIQGVETVYASFPNFEILANTVGIKIATI